MSYKALYRKYRPTTFSDVVGQEHITQTLKHEIALGKIFHAYLFTGTRGTGKTSCAKILAKAINCLSAVEGDPCGKCENCKLIELDEMTDVVEIDAASNNGVENIRNLREQVVFTPVTGKYRVYIIDEVHMLSSGAFNALLKTLEEPPAHAVFILATTEVHKLPATILSRCQRFDFKRIDSESICQRIAFIAEREGFTITDEAAAMIAAASDGGMRDALSILDLCVSANRDTITEETVASVCGMSGNESLLNLAEYIKAGDTENALMCIDSLYSHSVDMLRLLNDLIEHYRNLMIVKTVSGNKKPIVCYASHLQQLTEQAQNYSLRSILWVLRNLQDALPKMQTGNRRCEMEILIIRLCMPDVSALGDVTVAQKMSPQKEHIKPIKEPKPAITTETADEEIPLPQEEPEDVPDISADVPKTEKEPTHDGRLDDSTWNQVITELSKSAPLISGMLADSSAYINGAFLLIDTQNQQFPELINQYSNYRDKLRKAIENVTGVSYKLGPYRRRKATVTTDDPLLEIKNKLDELKIPKRSN